MSEDKEISWQTAEKKAEKKADSVDSRRSIRVSLTYTERRAIIIGLEKLKEEALPLRYSVIEVGRQIYEDIIIKLSRH